MAFYIFSVYANGPPGTANRVLTNNVDMDNIDIYIRSTQSAVGILVLAFDGCVEVMEPHGSKARFSPHPLYRIGNARADVACSDTTHITISLAQCTLRFTHDAVDGSPGYQVRSTATRRVLLLRSAI